MTDKWGIAQSPTGENRYIKKTPKVESIYKKTHQEESIYIKEKRSQQEEYIFLRFSEHILKK